MGEQTASPWMERLALDLQPFPARLLEVNLAMPRTCLAAFVAEAVQAEHGPLTVTGYAGVREGIADGVAAELTQRWRRTAPEDRWLNHGSLPAR